MKFGGISIQERGFVEKLPDHRDIPRDLDLS
jgi:hypothetical protein